MLIQNFYFLQSLKSFLGEDKLKVSLCVYSLSFTDSIDPTSGLLKFCICFSGIY